MRELIESAICFSDDFKKFSHMKIVWKEGGNFFYTTHPERRFDLETLVAPSPIPLHLIRGIWHGSLTEVRSPSNDMFVKVQSLVDYPSLPLGTITLEEAMICEFLKQNPHPNIAVYYGCKREGDYINGLCFKRYSRALDDVVESGKPFDRKKVLHGITTGVNFLHSFGLVHNDIKPGNVMLEEDDTPVLIDFDSCRKEGETMGYKKGTPGWFKRPVGDTASKSTDLFALMLVDKYLKGEYNGEDELGEFPEIAGQIPVSPQ